MHCDNCQRAPGTVLACTGYNCPTQGPGTVCGWSTGQRLFPKGSMEEASLFWWPEFSPMNTSHGWHLVLEPAGALSLSQLTGGGCSLQELLQPISQVTHVSQWLQPLPGNHVKLTCWRSLHVGTAQTCKAWPWLALQPLTTYTPEMGPDPAKAAPYWGQQCCMLYEYADTYSP